MSGSNLARKIIESTEGGTVLPFRRKLESETNQSNITWSMIEEWMCLKAEGTEVGPTLEGQISDWLLEAIRSERTPFDDPFDAIYIAELRPDPIVNDDYRVRQECAHIQDVSDQIYFDDGMDD